MVDDQGSSRRWPITAGGLASPRNWREVEGLVADLLASLPVASTPVDGEGFSLGYLPFTDLGRAEALDLSWEVQLARGGRRTTDVGLGAHPVDAVLDLGPTLKAASLSPLVVRSGAGEEVEHRWAGWSQDLRRLAEVAATRPAVVEEPSPAGFDLDARWSCTTAGGT